MHARGPADTEGSSLSPRIKRRIRAKTSMAELERRERGRTNIPGPPRLRTLINDAAEVPISEGSLVPASTPTSGIQRAHPYTPVGNAVGSSSFEMVPPVRARAASERGLDDSMETVPITRANSSPSIIQTPTHGAGVWGRVQGGWWGVVLLWKMRERGRGRRGWGVGWGPAKEPASQCASFVETTL